MTLGDRTSIRCRALAAIGAGVFATLAVANSGPAWGQDTGDPAPLIGHGFLLDKGVFTTIDHPDAVAETGASSINNRGQIVGGYIDAQGTTHGFLLDEGVFTPIDHPDAASGLGAGTAARDINKRGQIVGFYVDAEGTLHGFLRDKEGVFTPIDHPDAPQGPAAGTTAFGINDHGQIVGYHVDVGAESARGFLLGSHDDPSEEGVFTAIDVPGAVDTLPSAIDNRGQIVGAYSDAGGTAHGFMRDTKGTFRTIDHPDATLGPNLGTLPLGVNNRGQIAGQFVDADLRCHGFLLSRGAFTAIDDPDALSTTGAGDINDRGQIVGFRDGRTGLGGCSPPAADTGASDPESTDQ